MEIRFVLGYLFLLSLIGFLLMGIDKWKAKKGRWRISEKTLFLAALLGGSAGACLGMYAFRHKTKHWYFKYGFPTIFLIQLVLLSFWFYRNF